MGGKEGGGGFFFWSGFISKKYQGWRGGCDGGIREMGGRRKYCFF